MPVLEGAAPGIGAAVASTAIKVEGGGLGATVGSVGKIEGLGASIQTSEIGNITVPNVPDVGANLAAKLDTTLETPKVGIQEVANVSVPDVAPNGMQTPAISENVAPGMETPITAPDASISSPHVEVSGNGRMSEGATDTAKVNEGVSAHTSEVLQNEPDVSIKQEAQGNGTQPEAAGNVTQQENSNGNPLPESATTESPDAAASGTAKPETDGQKPQVESAAADIKDNNGNTNNPQEAEKAKPSDKQETKSLQDAEKQKRTQELEEKVTSKTATADELKELRGLKQDPEQRRNDLEQKALDGTITDQEAKELGDMNASENSKELTPEQQAEKLQKDIDELGTELMTKMANGQEITAQDLERLRNLRGQEQLINQGFTPDQAKAAIREAIQGKAGGNERQARGVKELQDKIQQLMAIEMQMLSMPKTVDALRKQRKEVQDKAQAKHNEAKGAMSSEQRLQKRGEEYTLYMQIANINSVIVRQKYMVPILEAKRQDLEQYVRRKVGVSHGFGALMEWGAAKTRSVATEIGVGAAEDMDYTMGRY